MNPTPNPAYQARPAISAKIKWRLGLLAVVAVLLLLPTLFLVLRTASKPQVMQVLAPAGRTTKMVGAPADALTILVGDGNQLYYYFGKATPTAVVSLHAASPAQPIGQVVKAWQQQHRQATVFIKPSPQAGYKALVAMLDEMNLAGQRSYAVVVPTEADRQLLTAERR